MGNPVKQSDIYSTAASLYHLVVGQTLPAKYDDRPAAVDQLPTNWQPVFRQALDNDFTRRQRNVHDFKNALTQLLPSHMQPAPASGATGTAQPTGPGQPASATIRWKQSAVAMINPGEYREAVAGRVWQGNGPVANAEVTPFITDIAGSNNGTQGQMVKTGAQGDFTLAIADITVPVKVPRRFIEVVVVDSNTGVELVRETVKIKRPWNSTFVKVGAGAGKLITSPIRFGKWVGQQGAGALNRVHGVQIPLPPVGRWGRNIAQGVQNAGGGAINAIRNANPIYLFAMLALVFLGLTVLTAVLEDTMSFLGYIWPNTLVIAFLCAGGSFLTYIFRGTRFAVRTMGFLGVVWLLCYTAYQLGKW